MGFGKLFKAQDQLTDYSNKLSVQGGQMKQQAAQQEANALRMEGDLAYRQTQEEKVLKQREIDLIAGNQEYDFIQGGVFGGVGTPLAAVNETRKLGQMVIDSMDERANLMQDLYRSRADITERSGLADLLMAEGSTYINSEQTRLSQMETKGNFYRSVFSNLASGGLSILKGFMT